MRRFKDLTKEEKREYILLLFLLPPIFFWDWLKLALKLRTLPKRAVAVCLAVVMVAAMFPATVFAANVTQEIHWAVVTEGDDTILYLGNAAHELITVETVIASGTHDMVPTMLDDRPYHYYASTITKVIIESQITPKSCRIWFSGFTACTSIEGLDKLDTSKAESMSSMFNNCGKLTSLDLSKFDTSKVDSMRNMFAGCSGLTGITFGTKFDTAQVTDMSQMFSSCYGLTSLDLSEFDTAKVTNMSLMFNNCGKLTSLDLSKFDTSSVTNMSYMFSWSNNLTGITFGDDFDTTKVANMSYMFSNCKGLTSLDLSSFNTSKVTNMSNMFNNCGKLTSLDLSGFNTSSVQYMSNLFYGCSGLNTIKTPATNALEIALPSSNYAIDGQAYDSKPDESKLPTTTGESKTLRRVYDISYTMNDGTNNSANPTYFLYSDDSQTITLTPPTKENNTFTGWSASNGVTVNGNSITIPAKQASNVTLTANFNINQYTVSVIADPTAGGTVSGGGTYNYNTSVTVTATANTGYRFVNWTENGTQVSTDASYTFTATDARNLVANFELITYTVTWKNYDGSLLETDTGVAYNSTPSYNGTTPVRAEDESFTYTFKGWSPTISAVTDDIVYTAEFTATSKRVEPSYTVTIPATANEGESITVSATDVMLNADETLTVTLQSDFKLKNEQNAELAFTINGGAVGNNAVVLSVTGNGDKNNPLSLNSAPLTIEVAEQPKYAGIYAGTITFTIAVNTAENN